MIGQGARLGEQLVSAGMITEEQLAEALAAQQASGAKLGGALIEIGAIGAAALAGALAERLGVKSCVLRHGLIDPQVAKSIPKEEAERLKVLPMFRVQDRPDSGETLTVAMAEPQSLPTLDRLRALTGCHVRPVLALEDNIEVESKTYATVVG